MKKMKMTIGGVKGGKNMDRQSKIDGKTEPWGSQSQKSLNDFKHALDTLAYDLAMGENSENCDSGSYGD